MIEPCRDYRRVKRLSDRFADDPWRIIVSNDCHYLMEVEDGEDLGVWGFHPCTGGMEIHAVMSEKCRGKRAAESARAAISWVFDNTDTDEVFACIPNEQRHVRTLAVDVGLCYKSEHTGHRLYSMRG